MVGCNRSDVIHGTERYRINSPDKHVDAVVVNITDGTTTSSDYLIYITLTGNKPKAGHECIRGEKMTNLKIKWRKAKYLEISYTKGYVSRFTNFENFWDAEFTSSSKYQVEIRLVPREEHSLP